MAIGATLLTSNYDNVNRTSYTTASVSVTAGAMVLLGVSNTKDAGLTCPSTTPSGLSGLAVGWTLVDARFMSGNRVHASMWYCIAGGATSGALTLTMVDEGSGATSIGTAWAVVELTGVASSGTIVQTNTASPAGIQTSVSTTLAAAGNSNNRSFGWQSHEANTASTPGAGMTELSDTIGATPNHGSQMEWSDTAFQTPVAASWTTSSNCVIVACEVKAAAAAAPPWLRRPTVIGR